MSKIPRKPKVTQSVAANKMVKTPPLNQRDKPDSIRQSQIPKNKPVQPPQEAPSRQSQVPRARPAPSPKLMKAKAEAEAKAERDAKIDVFEESERIRKQMDQEFGDHLDEKAAKLEWMDKFEEMQKELNENFHKEVAIDTGVVSNFEDAAKQVKMTNDVFGTTKKIINAGFDALHENLSKERELLQKRMELIAQMRNEMMSHGPEDYTADLEPDNDPDFEDASSSPQPQPIKTVNPQRNHPKRK